MEVKTSLCCHTNNKKQRETRKGSHIEIHALIQISSQTQCDMQASDDVSAPEAAQAFVDSLCFFEPISRCASRVEPLASGQIDQIQHTAPGTIRRFMRAAQL